MKLILHTSEDSSIFFVCVEPETENRTKERKLIGRGGLCVLLLTTLLFLYSCGILLLDGPLNQGRTLVPELLYANNETDLVTFWDEDLQAYRTSDQQRNVYLRTAVFSLDPQDSVATTR